MTAACQGSSTPEPPSAPLPPLVVVDLRGSWVVAFFADAERVVDCVVDTSQLSGAADLTAAGALAWEHEGMEIPDGHHVDYAMGIIESAVDGEDLTYLVGAMAPGVDRVTVDIPELGEARATIAGEWFVIWWPSSEAGATLRALDADGRVL